MGSGLVGFRMKGMAPFIISKNWLCQGGAILLG